MSFCKFRKVDFEEESTIFGYILRGNFREFIDKLKYLVGLFIAEESICFVMERDVPEDPLQVCESEYPGDKLPGPIFSVEIATWHGKVEGLYGLEVRWDMAHREIPPSNEILTGCERF